MSKHLLAVNLAVSSMLRSMETLRQEPEFANLGLLVLTKTPQKFANFTHPQIPVRIIACSYESQEEIAAAIEPFIDDVAAVICRGDKHIQYLSKLVPLLPDRIVVPTVEALTMTTDKHLMRQAFEKYAPDITPAHVQVKDSSEQTISSIEAAMPYPVIIKPTNLASSMLIQSCENRSELAVGLQKVFKEIIGIYEREDRHETPEVIVEEFLTGAFYSIDAYAMDDGDYYYCQPVGYLPAKSMGIDDFFLYKRWIPTELTREQVAAANMACAKAMSAVGLTHSTAHIELILTANGWKIIELGPRIGRFRQLMYGACYGFDHSLNDIRIKLGKQPLIKDELQKYCTAYSIYPHTEGTLVQITGASEAEAKATVQYCKRVVEDGQPARFAKHGGSALLELIIASSDPEEYQRDCDFIENNVSAVVELSAD